jgi:hypothetical protein
MKCREGEVVAENNMVIPVALMDIYTYHEVIYSPKP